MDISEKNVKRVKEEVDLVIARFQKLSAMLHGLAIMHEDRNGLKARILAISGELNHDMGLIKISDPKKRKILEDALGEYYEGERRAAERKLKEWDDAITSVDQDVRRVMKVCAGTYTFDRG